MVLKSRSRLREVQTRMYVAFGAVKTGKQHVDMRKEATIVVQTP
jgi:hypothetical protein